MEHILEQSENGLVIINNLQSDNMIEISSVFSQDARAAITQMHIFGQEDSVVYKYIDAPDGPFVRHVESTYESLMDRIKSKSKHAFNLNMYRPSLEDGVIYGKRGVELSIDLLSDLIIAVEMHYISSLFNANGCELSVYLLHPQNYPKLNAVIKNIEIDLSSMPCHNYWNKDIPQKIIPFTGMDFILSELLKETKSFKIYEHEKNKEK